MLLLPDSLLQFVNVLACGGLCKYVAKTRGDDT